MKISLNKKLVTKIVAFRGMKASLIELALRSWCATPSLWFKRWGRDNDLYQ